MLFLNGNSVHNISKMNFRSNTFLSTFVLVGKRELYVKTGKCEYIVLV